MTLSCFTPQIFLHSLCCLRLSDRLSPRGMPGVASLPKLSGRDLCQVPDHLYCLPFTMLHGIHKGFAALQGRAWRKEVPCTEGGCSLYSQLQRSYSGASISGSEAHTSISSVLRQKLTCLKPLPSDLIARG